MTVIELLLCILGIVTSVICSVKDIQTNRVPNRILTVSACIGLGINFIYAWMSGARYLPTFCINMVLADLFALLMYAVDYWAAGDAKLFITLYLCFPARWFDTGSLTNAVVPYMLIFVPALLWVVVDSVFRYAKKEAALKAPIDIRGVIKRYLCIYIETTALYGMLLIWFPELIETNGLFVAALMIIYSVFCGSSRYMTTWLAVGIHGVVIIIIMMLMGIRSMLPAWYSYLMIAAVFVFQQLVSRYNYQEIPTKSVKPGIVLECTTVMQFRTSRVQGLPDDFSERLRSRITKEQADAILRWENSVHGKPTIWIVRKMPFAIMIGIGYILWLVIRWRW